MPIPTHVLADLAARYGHVDPTDRQAVEDFYVNLATADDPATKQAVAREMLERQDEPDPGWDLIAGLPDD